MYDVDDAYKNAHLTMGSWNSLVCQVSTLDTTTWILVVEEMGSMNTFFEDLCWIEFSLMGMQCTQWDPGIIFFREDIYMLA